MSAIGYKRRPFCICFYCICRGARVVLCRGFHRHRRVTAHASRNPTHDSEGEGKRGLGMGFHRVNYTIFAALCVGFRDRFPWPRKVSVVKREQILVLNQNRRGLSTFQLFNRRSPPGSAQPFNFSTCLTAAHSAAQTAAQGAAESSNIHPSIYSKTYTEGSNPFVPQTRMLLFLNLPDKVRQFRSISRPPPIAPLVAKFILPFICQHIVAFYHYSIGDRRVLANKIPYSTILCGHKS